MSLDSTTIIQRIDALLGEPIPGTGIFRYVDVIQRYQSTLTLITILYGADSHQAQMLLSADDRAKKTYGELAENFPATVLPVITGILQAMRADVEAGLVGRIGKHAAGEVLGDMLALAKEALGQGTDPAKNVAAVLTAAAYEDTIRQMGALLANVEGRPDLADIITALKKAGVLVGAALTTGLGYLKFRNDSLHADWENVDRAVVGSCLAFVEGLLLKHFS